MMAAASLTALAGVSRCGLAVRTGARGQTDRGGEAEEWSTMQAKQGCVLTLIQNVAVAVMWPLCAVAGDKQGSQRRSLLARHPATCVGH